LSLQSKLLKTLETGLFSPLGATANLRFRARVLVASQRNLQSLVKVGAFHEELYVRLSIMQIDVPPLRARKADIPLLVDSFIEKYAGAESELEFSFAAMSYLLAYGWPGNVRELEEAVRHAVAAVSGPIVGVEDLNMVLGGRFMRDAANPSAPPPLDDHEKNA